MTDDPTPVLDPADEPDETAHLVRREHDSSHPRSTLARMPLPAASDDAAARTLTAMVGDLASAATVEQVTHVVTRSVRRLLRADGATFVLREDEACFYADEDAIAPLWKGRRFPQDACVSGWVMRHGTPVTIRDIRQDDRIPQDAYRETFVTSLALAPVRSRDPLGAIGAYWADSYTPTDAQVRLLRTIADSAAVALENVELRGTAQRRADERDVLAERADELEAAIHTIAHDLRSPLGAILGITELLDDALSADGAGGADGHDGADERHLRAFTHRIAQSGHRMSEQIDRMLALYKVNHRPLEPARLDLTDLALQVIRALGVTERQRDLHFSIDEGLTAHADPVLTRVLLENLIGNAVKYTAREPVARIELTGARGDHLGSPSDLATFVVRDNGVGFAAEQTHLLFRPSSRLHTDDEFAGTGLGLASVARIVERHGGEVRAEGSVSQGASFSFALPRAAG